MLEPADVDLLVAAASASGGETSSRTLADGTTTVYELNATWYALMAAGHPPELALRRHLAAHAVMFALRGIPATYVQSVVAGDNDRERFARTGEARSLHRRRFDDVEAFSRAVKHRGTRAGAAWQGLLEMLGARAATPAFHPDSDQIVLDTPPAVFAVERVAADGERARVYVNVSGEPCAVGVPRDGARWSSLVGGPAPEGERLVLPAWSSAWLDAAPA